MYPLQILWIQSQMKYNIRFFIHIHLLGVSAYDYVFDRVSKEFKMISLAQLIRQKST